MDKDLIDDLGQRLKEPKELLASKKGNSPVQRSPQEKKKLSYAKDRRNLYGNNDKASRKLVPLRKAQENRDNRRRAKQQTASLETIDEAKADLGRRLITP